MPNQIPEYDLAMTQGVDGVQVTRNPSDRWTYRGYNNIPKLSLESAGKMTLKSL